MLKLSRRMQLIFDFLVPGEPVWDFCCDHGYMGLNAYESGLFPEVHFVDQVPHIIEQVQQRFQTEHFRENSSARAYFFAVAGEDIPKPLYGSAIIAGVGAYTIFKILESLHERDFLHAKRLILCPQRDDEKLKEDLRKMSNFSYEMTRDCCEIVERGRGRKLLIFDKI